MKPLRILLASVLLVSAAWAAPYRLGSADISINTDGWALNDSAMSGLQGALLNAANFGAGGTVNREIQLSFMTAANAATFLSGVDGFMVSWWQDSESATYQAAIIAAFLNGMDLWLLEDDTIHDLIGELLGLPTSDSTGSPSNGGAPLFSGPFGLAVNVAQGGNVGQKSATDVAAKGGTVAATNTEGQITAVLWERGVFGPTAGRLLIMADVDMVSDFGATYTPLNDNGRFALNGAAWLVRDDGAVPEPGTFWLLAPAVGLLAWKRRR